MEAYRTELNNLDDLITVAMLSAEKRTCAKKDVALWLPTLEQSNLAIQYWNIVLKSTQQQVDASTHLQKFKDKMTKETLDMIENCALTNRTQKQ
jgi:hypothetical protein